MSRDDFFAVLKIMAAKALTPKTLRLYSLIR